MDRGEFVSDALVQLMSQCVSSIFDRLMIVTIYQLKYFLQQDSDFINSYTDILQHTCNTNSLLPVHYKKTHNFFPSANIDFENVLLPFTHCQELINLVSKLSWLPSKSHTVTNPHCHLINILSNNQHTLSNHYNRRKKISQNSITWRRE